MLNINSPIFSIELHVENYSVTKVFLSVLGGSRD